MANPFINPPKPNPFFAGKLDSNYSFTDTVKNIGNTLVGGTAMPTVNTPRNTSITPAPTPTPTTTPTGPAPVINTGLNYSVNPPAVNLNIPSTISADALNYTPSGTSASETRKANEYKVITSKYAAEEEKLLRDVANLRTGIADLTGTQSREYRNAELNPEGMFGGALSSTLSRLSKDQAIELNARTNQLNAYLDNLKMIQGYRPDVLGTPQVDETTGEGYVYIQDPTTGAITTQSLGVIASPKPKEGFTLGKDQVRYDANGNVLASGPKSVSPSPASFGTGLDSDLARMINVQGSFITSENQRNSFESAAQSYLQRGDYAGLKYYLRNQAVNNVPANDQIGYRKNLEIMKSLDNLDNIISKMEAAGVDSGILKGSWQTILNKLGALGKPELVTLGYQAQQAMDLITRQRTGAALNASEEKFYKQMVPGIFKGADLNKELIQNFRNTLQNNTDSYLGVYFSPEEIGKLDQASKGTRPSLESLFQ